MLTRLAIAALIGIGGTLVVALGLVASDGPRPDLRSGAGGLDFARLAPSAPDVPLQTYAARDGGTLGCRRWDAGADGVPLVVAVHGSGWHGAQFRNLGAALAGQGLADVVAPDLRGHGPAPARLARCTPFT